MYVLIQSNVLKVENSYWYKIGKDTKRAEQIVIGSIVNVILNGRKVRGWVIKTSEDEPSEVDASKIKDVLEFVSCGPSSLMVDFCIELSQYYLVSPSVFLDKCSPDVKVNHVETKKNILTNQRVPKREVLYVDARENRRELILENVSTTGSTIIMTPDSRMKIADFLRQKGFDVVVIGVDGKITKEIFQKISSGNVVVISSRKAIFSNVPDLASIIVLDDGFEQLRDERTPKFHGVDIAKLRAKKEKCNLCVITSVPTVVTHDLDVKDLRNSDYWPKINIEDLNKADPQLGMFTHKVTNAIKKAKDAGKDVGLIINNTAIAKKIICATCQSICVCENCGHNVIIDQDSENLVCEICESSRAKICSQCGSIELKKYRKGSKSLKDELSKLFTNAQVIEINKESTSNTLGDNFKIFIGTESIFHRPNVTKNIGLFIFLDFDSYLLRPRADAFEQSLISVTRAMRVVKRSELDTSIMLLTRMINHEIIQDLKQHDFVAHLKRDLELKKQLSIAPFKATAFAKIKIEDFDDLVDHLEQELVKGFIDEKNYRIVSLVANDHGDLTEKAYNPLRHFASKHRLSLAVDSYE